jgi:hypothetical protein
MKFVLMLQLSGAAGFCLLCWAVSQSNNAKAAAAWTLDLAVLTLLIGGAAFGLLFGGAHYALRWAQVGASWAYGLAGTLAALVAFLGLGGLKSLELAQEVGALSLALGLPALLGAILGLVYHRRAGSDHDADRPAKLEAALARVAPPPAADGSPALPAAALPALITADGRHYYAGPLRVRSSLLLLFASGAAVGGLLSLLIIVIGFSTNLMVLAERWAGSQGMLIRHGVGISIMLITTLGVTLFIPNVIAHKLAQKFKIVSTGGYCLMGFGSCIAIGFLLPFFWLLAPPTAVSMAIYRRWAGLEPESLPPDVHVSDERALVGADHPARRYHKVIQA